MPNQQNMLGQPVGVLIPSWSPPPFPPYEVLEGRFCNVAPLVADRDAPSLYEANSLDKEGKMWTYLPYGPFASLELYRSWLRVSVLTSDPQFYAIIDKVSNKALGVVAFLRIDTKHGAIEVGHLVFSPPLQRTPAATEAIYLMMKHAFELGYRRFEWRGHALNEVSRRSVQRFGLSFEGVLRQATVSKGRNRDTAWYAAIDEEWPALKAAFDQWLSPSNFDEQCKQKVSLSSLTKSILKNMG